MTQTHTCPNCFHPLENKDTLRLKFLKDEDADLERHLISEGRDMDGWWFNGKTSDGWGNTPEEAIDDAMKRKALYHKKETIKRVQGHSSIWECTEDTHTVDEDYKVGFYFADEAEGLNGPFPTFQDAQNALLDYVDSLNAHLDFDDTHWDKNEE